MMACALVGPIPKSLSNCSAEAVLILTISPEAALPEELRPVAGNGVSPGAVSDGLVAAFPEVDLVDFAFVAEAEPKVTWSLSASALVLPRPLTFSKSVKLL